MSHSKERKEKICLNCNAELHGLYCHVCGQENREPKETVLGLIVHFFQDITHFDGKFFKTVKYLITKPGFLSSEYLKGRRARYLNPVRMYIFTSALFFLIFFSLYNAQNLGVDSEAASQAVDSIDVKMDSIFNAQDLQLKDSQDIALRPDNRDTNKLTTGNLSRKKGWNVKFTTNKLESRKQYDSIQKSLPPEKRDNWFIRRMTYRNIELKKRYQDDTREFLTDLLNSFIHMFPYLLFVSLPLYALFLKLLYVRRKQFYYADHGIFLLHLYIFTFLLLIVYFGLNKIKEMTGANWINWLLFGLFLYGVGYTLKAMLNFYEQGWGKTIVKFIVLNILAFVSILALFVLFGILTLFSI